MTVSLPPHAGIGLRSPHHQDVLLTLPPVSWWEVHSENFFVKGGPLFSFMHFMRNHYPISFHGVGLSLGGKDNLFQSHLKALCDAVSIFEPTAVSEHLSWSSLGQQHFNDLWPLPYTHATLSHVCERIERTQDALKRQIIIENPSSYLQWKTADWTEWDFLVQIAQKTGCGILLDINNIYVSAHNHGFDPLIYLRAIPGHLVQEIHLAGHEITEHILIDSHDTRVSEPVWDLYRQAINLFGPKPTLIEWDSAIPPLDVLAAEASKANHILEKEPCHA